jgi:hypothetical protein
VILEEGEEVLRDGGARLRRYRELVVDFPGVAQVALARLLGVKRGGRRYREQYCHGDSRTGG